MIDIRLKTRLIIRRGNEYLVGQIMYSEDTRWSTSPWDAWHTRDRERAGQYAATYGGTVELFNPIVGQLRGYRQ